MRYFITKNHLSSLTMSERSPPKLVFDMDDFNPKENGNENEILEDLFNKFSEEIDYHKKAEILHLLIQTYRECFRDGLENNVTSEFLELLPEIPFLCEKFLKNSENASTNGTVCSLEKKTKNLESAYLCFDDVLLCLETFADSNHHLILIKTSVNLLSQGYTHCKESEEIYGDLLEQFGDQLGTFFKKIETLQTVVLLHLNKVDIKKYGDSDLLHINFIAIEIGNLCQIVFSLDADIAFELWGKYLRIITELQSLKDISNINSVCVYLASKNIENIQLIKYNLVKISEEDEEIAAKFFFYLDALSNMMNFINGSFKDDLSEFRAFSFNLLDCLVSCYSPLVNKSGLNIIKDSLMKNTFLILSHLCCDEEFLKFVYSTAQEKEFHLGILLLKLCSLQFMDKLSLQFKRDFLKGIFSDFLANSVEDDMKMLCHSIPLCTLAETNSDELVTLFQLSHEIISKHLKRLPDSAIKEMESTVLSFLVSSSDVAYLWISDVWMYRLRRSSLEFLKERCYAVLQNLHMKNINNDKIENLAKRMLKFLPSSYKDPLLEAFSSLRFVQDSKKVQHRFGIPDHTSTENETSVCSEKQIKDMMHLLSENSTTDDVKLAEKACTCFELCVLFVSVAGCPEILQFLELAALFFKTDVYEIQISILSFIKSLSRKSLPEHTQEFGKIVSLLAQLFSEAIHSKNYIVKYEARNIFSYFAKCTPHIKIVQETVRRDSTLKGIMKSYINAVPENNFLSEKEKTSFINKQILHSKNVKFEISPKTVETLQQLFSRYNFKCLV